MFAVFFYSKNLIQYDLDERLINWKLERFQYFKLDVLEYYFSKTRCNDCGKDIFNKNVSFCPICLKRRCVKKFVENVFEKKSISDSQIVQLFTRFINYILQYEFSFGTSQSILNALLPVFNSLTKDDLKTPLDVQEVVCLFNKNIDMKGYDGGKKVRIKLMIYVFKFFIKENLLIRINNQEEIFENLHVDDKQQIVLLDSSKMDELEKAKIEEKIKRLPYKFQKLLLHYLNEYEIQKEVYRKKNTIKSLEWRSIDTRIEAITRLLKECLEIGISNWNEITEEIINKFLLKYKKQEYVDLQTNGLYNFFQFAKNKKYIFDNPVPKIKARSYAIIEEPFKPEDHKGLVNKLIEYSKQDPTTALLISLCYFHALSSKQISHIKLSNINFDAMTIKVNGRPKVYMDNLEMKLVEDHLRISKTNRIKNDAEYLFFSNTALYPYRVSNKYILKRIKKSCNFNPKQLRRAGIQYCAAMFGAEFLKDIFGISMTHLQRFGDVGDQLIERIIVDEINNQNTFN